jgi:carbonic anhydrase/acetyltransferase-like protein (isoleucine patch superfamily)
MALYEYRGARPQLGRDVYVAPGAHVIGDVTLGDESSVWFGAVIRGDLMPIRIGARTNIQDGVVIHVTGSLAKTTIGDEVTVGHKAILHGCTVGSRVLIGMGSIVLDGAVIGDDVFLGAGSLVTQGMNIPAGSLAMGSPAKIVRPVSDGHRAWIRHAAQSYLDVGRVFRSPEFKRIDE